MIKKNLSKQMPFKLSMRVREWESDWFNGHVKLNEWWHIHK